MSYFRSTNEESAVSSRTFRVDKLMLFDNDDDVVTETESCLDTNRTDEMIDDILREEAAEHEALFDNRLSYPDNELTRHQHDTDSLLLRNRYNTYIM